MSKVPYRTFPVVLAAPSGTGKTTIARALVKDSERFVFSVSATTRPPREGERSGADYQFVDDETFQRMVEQGEMAEWAEVHGHRYGTPVAELERAAEQGKHAVLDIDVAGARQVRTSLPEAVLIFVLPPSVEALLGRLSHRGTEKRAQIKRRLLTAVAELDQVQDFDYVVVNRELSEAIADVRAIVGAEAHRITRARDLLGHLERLRRGLRQALADESAGSSE